MPIFTSQTIHDAVNVTLKDSNIGPDKNAFVAVVTTQGVKGVLTTKIGDHWHVTGYVGIDHEKHIDGGAEVLATW